MGDRGAHGCCWRAAVWRGVDGESLAYAALRAGYHGRDPVAGAGLAAVAGGGGGGAPGFCTDCRSRRCGIRSRRGRVVSGEGWVPRRARAWVEGGDAGRRAAQCAGGRAGHERGQPAAVSRMAAEECGAVDECAYARSLSGGPRDVSGCSFSAGEVGSWGSGREDRAALTWQNGFSVTFLPPCTVQQ